MFAHLSNAQIHQNLKIHVGGERKILHVILQHIVEVEKRKIYLGMAYPSLKEYLVREFKYSESAAQRRMSAAEIMREVPVLSEKIQSGDLNLSQLVDVRRAIREKERVGSLVSQLQKIELVSSISGKTTTQTQKEIAVQLDVELKAPEKTFVQKDDSVHLQITLTQEQYQQLIKCKDLAVHTLMNEKMDVSLASVIEVLSKSYLKSKGLVASPKGNSLKGQAPGEGGLEKHNNTSQDRDHHNDVSLATNKKKDVKVNKSVTPKTRALILMRDACCQFKDKSTGKICGSTFGLEIDHRKPQWAAGDHTQSNLQVLCKSHNNYKYQKEANLRLL